MTQTLNKVTFGHLLTILAIILIPLLVWGVSIENRFEQVTHNTTHIQELTKEDKRSAIKQENQYDEVIQLLNDIKLQLKDKKDKE